jgi:hypothetical protein
MLFISSATIDLYLQSVNLIKQWGMFSCKETQCEDMCIQDWNIISILCHLLLPHCYFKCCAGFCEHHRAMCKGLWPTVCVKHFHKNLFPDCLNNTNLKQISPYSLSYQRNFWIIKCLLVFWYCTWWDKKLASCSESFWQPVCVWCMLRNHKRSHT